MSHEITGWIRDAITLCGIDAVEAEEVIARNVVQTAERAFVSGNPRAWWLGLSQPSIVLSSKDKSLVELLPAQSQRCWLIGESEEVQKPVFEMNTNDVSKVIQECPFFEYYIVAADFSWLLAESDHNEYYVCQSYKV